MGGNAGKYAKKGYDYVTGSNSQSGNQQTSSNALDMRGISPFVLTRTSSQYFDEDGHLAHEFYCEIKDKSKTGRVKLKRITKGIFKQGEVQLQIPRLNYNLPILIYEG